jgi:hypothetical protein
MQLKVFSFAAICAVFVACPAWAHHSHGNYDVSKWQVFEGTVKEVHLINPHSWIYLQIKDENGQTKLWALESTNPTGLSKKGITRDFLKAGETVRVRCHPLRDGTNGCLLGFVTPLHGDASRGTGVEVEWD